jgi:hypothetical protein
MYTGREELNNMLGVATGSAGARPRACLPGTGLLVADNTLPEASGALRRAITAHGPSQQSRGRWRAASARAGRFPRPAVRASIAP